MTYRPRRMKFGIFMAPFHRVGENPTLALKRDLQLIQHLDELGFDEAWIGEHHSYGRELIADPAVFIAAAAARTRRIKLGTGVTSLPYHHPLIVADTMVQLDHMTEGRAMLGVGPGALTSDAYMLGIKPVTQRTRMAEALDAIMALLRSREPVTMQTDWFTLRDARLQLANFSEPHLPVAVAATFTPAGPQAAGRHGVGLLSVAGADHEGFQRTWGWVEEAAAESGQTVNRADWRVVVPVHLADSRQEALDDLCAGFARRAYVGDRNMPPPPQPLASVLTSGTDIAEAAERGSVIVGTPDDAVTAVEAILERSGGLGGLLGLAHEWASTEKTLRSYELWARYVAPRFQNQLQSIEAQRDWIEANQALAFRGSTAAFAKAYEDAGKELPAQLQAGLDAARKAREGADPTAARP
ncbi:MAG TPA: LLM class flavin-dependent oxidoreductase [Dehalococcoidia bacterium]|nr:LLM class flavin-dependent oxidoreductase [Dehalococcoidia bacterium]